MDAESVATKDTKKTSRLEMLLQRSALVIPSTLHKGTCLLPRWF